MSGDPGDKETVILISPTEKYANVWTYERGIQKLIEEKLHIQPNKIHGRIDNGGARDYNIPKKFVTIRAPRKTNLTSTQRKAIGRRLQKARRAVKEA